MLFPGSEPPICGGLRRGYMADLTLVGVAGIESVRPARRVSVIEMVTREITFWEQPNFADPGVCRIGGIKVPKEAFLPGAGKALMLNKGWKVRIHPPLPVRLLRKVAGMQPVVAVVLKGRGFADVPYKIAIPRSAIERITKIEGSIFVVSE